MASVCAQNSITHEFQFWFLGNVLTPVQEARLELVSMCASAPRRLHMASNFLDRACGSMHCWEVRLPVQPTACQHATASILSLYAHIFQIDVAGLITLTRWRSQTSSWRMQSEPSPMPAFDDLATVPRLACCQRSSVSCVYSVRSIATASDA